MSQRPEFMVHVRAPGKINLALAVGPLGDDGYHELATVFCAVSLCEELHAHAAREFSVSYTGPIESSGLGGDDTLVHRAARLVAAELTESARERLGVGPDEMPGIRIVVEKHVPIAGGMGGGSADAAAALLACNAIWGAGLGKERLWELAAMLGADVPFALQGAIALGSGHGDVLVPVLHDGAFHIVLVPSEFGLSTPAVYGELDRLRADAVIAAPAVAPELIAAIRDGDVAALANAVHNDMEVAAFSLAPKLGELAARISAHPNSLRVFVSGSGPTLAVLTASRAHAAALVDALATDNIHAIATTAPVGGAHFVHDTPGVHP